MAEHHGHFMLASLLDSQLETLEKPMPEKRAIVISIDQRSEEIVVEIISALVAL